MGGFGPPAPPIDRVGVVDVDRIVAESARGREAQEAMVEAERQAENAIADLQSEMQVIAEEIQTMRSSGATEAALAERMAELAELQRQAGEAGQRVQVALAARRQQILEPVLEAARRHAERLGEEEDVGLIVERRSAAWFAAQVDLTGEILRMMAEEDGEPSSVGSLPRLEAAPDAATPGPRPTPQE